MDHRDDSIGAMKDFHRTQGTFGDDSAASTHRLAALRWDRSVGRDRHP